MAVVQIPNLPAAIALSGSEQLEAVQAGTSVRITVAQIGQALGSPASPNLSLQFNNGGVFGGSSGITTDGVARITLGDQQTTRGSLVLANTAAGAWPVTIQSSNSATAAWTMTLPPAVAAGNGFILTSNTSGVTSWTNPTALGIDLDVGSTAITNGTVSRLLFQGAGDVLQQSANLTFSSSTLTLGVAGSATGAAAFTGATSGTATITAQATAGSPTLTLPNASGTLVSTASAPLSINATTGAISITGAAGQVLAGATPAFTATPTFGVAGTTAGTLTLSGLTSGTVTLQTAAVAGTGTIFQFPSSNGASGTVLTTTGSGVTTWTSPSALGIDLDIGSTAITNGTAGRVLFQGAGDVLQQSANLFWDNANSRLGIGTASPASKLQIGASNTSTQAENIDMWGALQGSNGDIGRLRFFNVNAFGNKIVAQVSGARDGNNYGGSLIFSTGTQADTTLTERMRIDSSGQVGIGVSPSTILDINKSSNGIELIRINNSNAGALAQAQITIESNSGQINIGQGSIANNGGYGIMDIGTAGDFYFRKVNASGSIVWTTGGYTERMRITNAGAVNIVGAGSSGSPAVSFSGSANSNTLVVNASSNAGIGTALPGAKLHVQGANIWNTTTDFVLGSAGTIISLGKGAETGNTYGMINATNIGGSAWTNLVLQSGGGNVGIGTTSPSTYGKLSVFVSPATAGADGIYIPSSVTQLNSVVTGATYSFSGVGASQGWIYTTASDLNIGPYGAFNLKFIANNLERMRITSAGNVGIGISPNYKLQVNNDSAGTTTWITASNFTATGAFGSGFILIAGSGAQDYATIGYGADGSFTSSVVKPSGYQIWVTGGSERMRITSAGDVNIKGAGTAGVSQAVSISGLAPIDSLVVAPTTIGVGIGTSTINARLSFGAFIPANGQTIHTYQSGTTVSGLGIVSGAHRMFTSTGANLVFGHVDTVDGTTFIPRMTIDSAGNAGIGTGSSAPNFRLQLNSTSTNTAQYIQFTNGSTGSASTDGMICGVSSTNDAIVWMQESAPLRFATSNAEAMRIDSSGNVLVGTITSPTTGTQCLTIETGTAATATPADTVTFYSTDLSAGNTIPSIYTEGTGIVSANTGTTNLSNRIAVRINGTVYYLLAASSA